MDDISARRQRVAQMRGQKDQGDFGWDDFLTKILLPVGLGVAGGLTGGLGLVGGAAGLGAGLAGASSGMAAGTGIGGYEELIELLRQRRA